jgi:hypothetical protein
MIVAVVTMLSMCSVSNSIESKALSAERSFLHVQSCEEERQ